MQVSQSSQSFNAVEKIIPKSMVDAETLKLMNQLQKHNSKLEEM